MTAEEVEFRDRAACAALQGLLANRASSGSGGSGFMNKVTMERIAAEAWDIAEIMVEHRQVSDELGGT